MKLSEGVTGEFAVEFAWSRERNNILNDQTEQTMMNHVQTCLYYVHSMYIHVYSNLNSIISVYSKYIQKHKVLQCSSMYILYVNMFIQCMNKVHTSMYKLVCLCTCFSKAKSQLGQESNPRPLAGNPACLTPLLAAHIQSGQSWRPYLLFYLEVGDVCPAPDQPPPQPPPSRRRPEPRHGSP